MAGFNSPNILFLNTYDSLDRKYMTEIIPKLLRKGYSRYVELYAGGFAMPIIAATAGVKPENIYCYDISLYACTLGFAFSGQDVRALDVRLDGEPIELNDKDNIINAATILYYQALTRLSKCEVIYFKNLVRNMTTDMEAHIQYITERLKKMDGMLHGLHFEPLYIWDAFEKEKENENTFMISNPPTYKGAYEKFFDTKGRITSVCDDIKYEVWDGSIHCKQLMDKAENAKPLLFLLQQANRGKAATKNPICARYLNFTQNVYYNSNRPEEVIAINGRKETTLNETAIKKSKFPILPIDYEIKDDSKVQVFVEENKIAEYYKKIWLHRITGKAVTINFCVLVDGRIAGFIGISMNQLINPYNVGENKQLILCYATPAPNKVYRNARLLVYLSKSRKVMLDAITRNKGSMGLVQYMYIAEEICTVEYSKYHEVKGLRGLMKLQKKTKQGEVNALKYVAPLNDMSAQDCLNEFLKKEREYAKQKNSRA